MEIIPENVNSVVNLKLVSIISCRSSLVLVLGYGISTGTGINSIINTL